MKIYLDNNLGVTKVEQEELTQDTIGYNILKVYIPNAVLTPYDTFTCYYGALLQNGRKVGWFAMEARTSTDADYKANYTLYKATLEQCVVSVEGKVYIGCQVLLGNSGNATLIKKNTAVVQFNVRKSVAINNDILVLDTDQTTTDVLESYKNLLENALTTYATKATTYTKTEVDGKLDLKADKSDTYTKTEVDSALSLKADKSDTYTKAEVNEVALGLTSDIDLVRDSVTEVINRTSVLEIDVENLKSVQNVVEVVATKSALNSYDTTKIDVNDKIQVIADESHDGASTIYNWDGTQWQYVGAFGGNSYTKAETYNKTQIDRALRDKADKSNTYTRAVIDSMILTLFTDKADKSDTYTKTEGDAKFEEVGNMFEEVGNEVLKKANAEYISKGTTLTQTSYSNTNPTKSGKVKLYKLGGMSYKVNGTIQHSAVYAIHSMNGSNIYNFLSIPNEIKNLTGYGWGINNTCYNYIDFATKKFVQKVGTRAYQSGDESDTSIITDGTMTYYQLSSVVETDISSYITKDTLEVVEGGTLEFLNTYNQAVPNEVAYIFNAVTLNNIVDSNGNTNVIATKQELNEKSKVVANPTLSGNEATLEGAEIDGIKYKVGGGSEVHLYRHVVCLETPRGSILIENDNSNPFTFSTLHDFLLQGGYTTFRNLYPFTGFTPSGMSAGLYASMRTSTIWSITSKGGDTIGVTEFSEDIVTQIF